MDTRSAEEVERDIAEIKAHMPETYATIKAKAGELGTQAFALVRAGLRGEPNRFWAMERGWVKGTPFNALGMQEEVMRHMVQFGCAHACIFGWPSKEAGNGSN